MDENEIEDGTQVPAGKVIARMRRELLHHEGSLTHVRDALMRIAEGHAPEGKAADAAWIALACARLDEPFPPHPEIAEKVAKIAGQDHSYLRRLTRFALAAIEDEIAMALSARRSLAFMDALSEPVPTRFHHLPVAELKRALNAHGFALARRIPGWKD